MLPGSDGELNTSANIWLKGIVFTASTGVLRQAVQPGYRVSVGFKRRVSATDPGTDFQGLYERATSLATQRMSELVSPNPSPASIVCHGWRLLGEAGNVATAFLTLAVQLPEDVDNCLDAEKAPSVEELRSPGGTSLENLARLAQQRPEELYNEFDFTDAAACSSNLITVSYAESIPEIPEGDPFDFKPSVDRAEAFANWYHHILERFGEVHSPFRASRREWFLVDRQLVTVHIFFSR
ncbi:MAG TPA: hypothetical protein VGK64_28660 [Bryobacteraceae bacterium]